MWSKYTLDPQPDTTMEEFGLINNTQLLEIVKELTENKASGIQGINSKIIFYAIYALPEVFEKAVGTLF